MPSESRRLSNNQMIQVLNIRAEHPERLLGVLLAGHVFQLRRHPVEEAIQRPLPVHRRLDLLQERRALAVVFDEFFTQVDIDRVGLLVEPYLLLEVDAKAAGVILDRLDLAPVDQTLVVLQVFDLLEKRPVGRGVLADFQRHALERVFVVDIGHKAFHRVGEYAGFIRGGVATAGRWAGEV